MSSRVIRRKIPDINETIFQNSHQYDSWVNSFQFFITIEMFLFSLVFSEAMAARLPWIIGGEIVPGKSHFYYRKLTRWVIGDDNEILAHSQPHIVSLQKNKNHFCGASIVSSDWLISASHCHQIRLVQRKSCSNNCSSYFKLWLCSSSCWRS